MVSVRIVYEDGERTMSEMKVEERNLSHIVPVMRRHTLRIRRSSDKGRMEGFSFFLEPPLLRGDLGRRLRSR